MADGETKLAESLPGPRVLRRAGGKVAPTAPSGTEDFLLRPDPADPRLTERVPGFDEHGAPIETAVVVERPFVPSAPKKG